MPAIESIIFWVGGVVTAPLYKLTAAALSQSGCELDAETRFWIRDLTGELAAGAISESTYCEQVVNRASSEISSEELSSRIEQTAAPFPTMFPLFAELKELYRLCLLVDLPERWFRPLLQHATVEQHFNAPGALLHASQFQVRSDREVPLALVRSGMFTVEKTLLIRCQSAARHGLHPSGSVFAHLCGCVAAAPRVCTLGIIALPVNITQKADYPYAISHRSSGKTRSREVIPCRAWL